MKPGGGRAKGSGFERKVAKMVTKAFGVPKSECYRTPLSGGHMRASVHDPGDLVIGPKLRERFNFAVECKFYKSIDMESLLQKKVNGQFRSWWTQACNAAWKNAGRVGVPDYEPMLVFRQNRGVAYAMVRRGVCTLRPAILTRVCGCRVRVVEFSRLLEYLANVHS